MSAPHTSDSTMATQPVLYLAFELGWTSWKLAFTVGAGQKPRLRSIPARDTDTLMLEIQNAKRRFGLPEEIPIISCYEAGRDGFWLHRYLEHQGIENLVVDAASIEVNRRRRRAKSDNLDATKLVGMLIRWHLGEKKLWGVVHVPMAADEDHRQLHRELIALKAQRTEHTNRIKGLLAGIGLGTVIDAEFPGRLEGLRQWDDTGVPSGLRQRLLREFERWQLVGRQIHDLGARRTQQIRDPDTPQREQVRLLLKLKGIGEDTAWLLVREFFGWRGIRNRRELASLAGLTPTPYDSGESRREQGISKAGNRRVRWMMIELAWGWLRYQPESDLSRWYQRRFAAGNARLRKVGIVAVARKLLVALWKYLETGEVPAGAAVLEKAKFRGAGGERRVAS
ncbi:MAG TPA: IS110 family transposase [Thermoanaerobaculia bacterium]